MRIKACRFGTGLSNIELPADGGMLGVAGSLPSSDLTGEGLSVRNPSLETLVNQDRQFNFNHVEPRGVFGREVKLQLVQDPPCLRRWESRIEGSGCVGIEIVQHHADFLGVREMHVHQVAHTGRKIQFRALVGHFGVSPASPRLKHHEQIATSVALVFVVVTRGLTGLSRRDWTGVGSVQKLV